MNGPKSNWGQPIAYHPLLAKFFGSVNASIFFGQLAYWEPRAGANRGLGVYKSAQEWTDETGLSYREQTTARRVLTDAGYMTETHRRLEHRIYFRIEWGCFNDAFTPWLQSRGGAFAPDAPNDENAIGEEQSAALPTTIKQLPNDENAIGGARKRRSSIGTEITSETTNINTSPDGSVGKADPAESVSRCPHDAIVSLYHEALPELPRCRLMSDTRRRALTTFWRWVLSSKKSDGSRRATTAEQALEWIKAYFERAAQNDFLMGRAGRGSGHENWRADFDFLLTEKGKKQVIEKTVDQA